MHFLLFRIKVSDILSKLDTNNVEHIKIYKTAINGTTLVATLDILWIPPKIIIPTNIANKTPDILESTPKPSLIASVIEFT